MKQSKQHTRFIVFMSFTLSLLVVSMLIFSKINEPFEATLKSSIKSEEAQYLTSNASSPSISLLSSLNICLAPASNDDTIVINGSNNSYKHNSQDLSDQVISAISKLSLAFLGGIIISDGLFVKMGVI